MKIGQQNNGAQKQKCDTRHLYKLRSIQICTQKKAVKNKVAGL